MLGFEWLVWSGEIGDNVIQDLDERAQSVKSMDGTIFSGDSEVTGDYRKSKVRWLDRENFGDIYDILETYMHTSNTESFGLDVWDKAVDVQYTEYFGSEGGHYDWHHDVHWSDPKASQRKISIVIQLSDPDDYEGGDFEFMFCETPSKDLFSKKGSVLAFPSHQVHRVTPVTKGTRRTLVAWFEGARWR